MKLSIPLGALASLALAAPALADGGKDIASATPVVYGQQQFGNTANGGVDADDDHRSWWALGVTAGDRVTIKWQAQHLDTALHVLPVGTDDFNFPDADAFASDFLGDTGRSQLAFNAPRTGTMPMEFRVSYKEAAGPYDFTAYVKHAIRLSVPRAGSRPMTGSIPVGVRNPDGAPMSDPGLFVTLQAKRKRGGKRYRAIGTASAGDGTANVAYKVPAALRGKKVLLRALGGGAAYRAETSSKQTTVFR